MKPFTLILEEVKHLNTFCEKIIVFFRKKEKQMPKWDVDKRIKSFVKAGHISDSIWDKTNDLFNKYNPYFSEKYGDRFTSDIVYARACLRTEIEFLTRKK